jgi:glutamate/tyrosine decarboxylase-like PLP-dependent enzyme
VLKFFSYDTGDKAMQCGRHNDIFKLWLMWRSKGMDGYRLQINRLMQLARYFTRRIKATEGFEMVVDKAGNLFLLKNFYLIKFLQKIREIIFLNFFPIF